MNKYIISSVLVGILSASSLVWAEDTNRNLPTPTNESSSPAIRAKIQEQKNRLQQNVKDAKAKTEAEIKDAKIKLENTAETVKKDVKKRKEEFDNAIKVKREEFNNTVKAKRAELEDQIKTKREDLKVRLEKIKDEGKKQIVERIDKQIDALNDKMMRHFSSVLDKLEEMLVRINERADKVFAERGFDVSMVRSAIDKANATIASARSAIEIQSGKTYTITITTETALKTNVGKARQDFGADLTKVKDAVKVAQSAVKDAAVALAQLVVKTNVSPSPLVSPSVTPTP